MKTNKEALVNDKRYINKQNSTNWLERDIVLNINFQESIIRCILAIFVPWVVIAFNPLLMGYVAAPIIFYLFVSGLLHFCMFRYVWQHWIKHITTPLKCQFSVDLNISIKAV